MTEDRDHRSRRGLLGGAGIALASAVAVALEGCGGSSATSTQRAGTSTAAHPPSPSASPHDVRLLTSALELERRTVEAYVASVPLLDHHAGKAAAEWMGEELQHTGKLITLIRQAGGTAVARANSYDIGSFPRGQPAVLQRLAELEQEQIALYLKILPEFERGATRAAVASIFASDAQHLSLLRLLRGETPVPSAFVA